MAANLPRRRHSIRLKGYDYSLAGAYFITICTHNHQPLFGEITDGEMRLNRYGLIARNEWQCMPLRFEQIELGQFVVMPNHFHGILIMNDTARPDGSDPGRPALDQDVDPKQRVTVGEIVGAYKSIAANECLKLFKAENKVMGKVWQRNYFEHIIRDEKTWYSITAYISQNPAQWEMDSLYTGNKS